MMKTPKESQQPRKRGRPKNTHGPDKRDKILDIAEQLFAKQGLHNVTIKQIARQAKVDTALLHYYFDNKQGLIHQVFSRRAEILNKTRMAMLIDYEEKSGENPSLEGAITAFSRPMFELSLSGDSGWHTHFSLLAQLNNTPGLDSELVTQYNRPVIEKFIEVVAKTLPTATKEDIYWGFLQFSGSLMLSLAQTGRIDRLSDGLCRSDDLESAYRRFLPYAINGFAAIGHPS